MRSRNRCGHHEAGNRLPGPAGASSPTELAWDLSYAAVARFAKSDVAGPIDQRMGANEGFVYLDPETWLLRRPDAAVGVERIGHATNFIPERIVLGDVAFEIA